MAKMVIWRGRARKAEIHRDRLFERMRRLDRKIAAQAKEKQHINEMWGRCVRRTLQNWACADGAQAALLRWKRGMNAKDTQQIIDDALAFIHAMETGQL